MRIKYTIGVDEAGRGPLAGPVAVSAVLLPKYFNKWPLKRGLRDSKKLSEKKREEVFDWIKEQKEIKISVVFVPAETIDKEGIVLAIKLGVSEALTCVLGGTSDTSEVEVLLDGTLRAPELFKNQKTITKGDEKELSIAIASIIAKVTRDKFMEELSREYPQYNLHKHKGYGTKEHLKAIKKYGVSKIHRRSFCSGVATSEVDTT